MALTAVTICVVVGLTGSGVMVEQDFCKLLTALASVTLY